MPREDGKGPYELTIFSYGFAVPMGDSHGSQRYTQCQVLIRFRGNETASRF